jgi:hypothetical protein
LHPYTFATFNGERYNLILDIPDCIDIPLSDGIMQCQSWISLLPSAIVKVKPAEDTSQNDKELRVRKIQSVEYC